MRTVLETRTFQKQAEAVWSQADRHEFIDWISRNPDVGDVIPGGEGARKVRWSRPGTGKSAGVRIIYFHLAANELVLLVMLYAKTAKANVSLKEIKRS